MVRRSGDRSPGTDRGILYGTCPGYPQPGEEFIIDTDASNIEIGGVMFQVQDGGERFVSYFSKTLSKTEENCCVTH